jgi:peroxiredoxin
MEMGQQGKSKQGMQGQQGAAPVVTCTVTECSYNEQERCCAPQIEVGDQHPQCDTFTTSGSVDTMRQEMSKVGICHVMDCSFNKQEQCGAPGITVTHHSDHADCSSYRAQ